MLPDVLHRMMIGTKEAMKTTRSAKVSGFFFLAPCEGLIDNVVRLFCELTPFIDSSSNWKS